MLIVDSGVNLKGNNYFAKFHEKTVTIDNAHTEKSKQEETTRMEQWDKAADFFIVKVRGFRENNPAFFWLSLLSILSLPLYLFFRKSPAIPDLRYSELLIALVYTWGMQDIYEIVLTFFGVYEGNVSDAVYLLSIIPLKQLSGFKWWRTSLYVIISYLAALALLLAAMAAAIEIKIFLEAL
jgi:hypothetical protein